MRSRRVLPPVYFLGSIAVTLLLHYLLPWIPIVPHPWHMSGSVLILIGLSLIVVSVLTLNSRGTAIKPFQVSSVLVQDGPFAFSRNPIYVGMVVVVLGVAILLRGALGLVVPIVLAFVLQSRFIRHEERMLEATFGDDYHAYKARVRRWL